MTSITKDGDQTKTWYGVVVALVKDKGVYVSRRTESAPLFPKKWQLIHSRLKGGVELSHEAAIRITYRETSIILTKDRCHCVGTLDLKETNEFYYIYLVHLNEKDVVKTLADDKQNHSEWRLFKLEKAVVLDTVPGARDILKKMYRTMVRWDRKVQATINTEANETTDAYGQEHLEQSTLALFRT